MNPHAMRCQYCNETQTPCLCQRQSKLAVITIGFTLALGLAAISMLAHQQLQPQTPCWHIEHQGQHHYTPTPPEIHSGTITLQDPQGKPITLQGDYALQTTTCPPPRR